MILTSKINTTVGGAVYGAAEVAVGGAVYVAIDNAVRVAVSVGIYGAVNDVIGDVYDAIDNAVSVNDIFSGVPVNGTVGVLPQLIAWTKRQFRR